MNRNNPQEENSSADTRILSSDFATDFANDQRPQQEQDLTVSEDTNASDVVWSLWSNAFFLVGGMVYIVATTWQWTAGKEVLQSGESISPVLDLLWILGPSVYLLNAMIDVTWALHSLTRKKQKRLGERQRRQNLPPASVGADLLLRKKKRDGHKPKSKITYVKHLLRRLRRHVGHRRDLSAAATFGLAALLGVCAAVVNDDALALQLDAASIHMYLLSAVFALFVNPCAGTTFTTTNNNILDTASSDDMSSTGSTVSSDSSASATNPFSLLADCQALFRDASALGKLGDILFGLASVVDTILCDTHFDDDILSWPVLSAVLWMLDALLYIRGDYCTLYYCGNKVDVDTEEMSATDEYRLDTSTTVGTHEVSRGSLPGPATIQGLLLDKSAIV